MSKSINYCKVCNYSAKTKQHFNMHLLCKKHKNKVEMNTIYEDNKDNTIETNDDCKFICQVCSKKYKSYSGLWNHKKKCKNTKKPEKSSPAFNKLVLLEGHIKEQSDKIKELKNIIMELIKKDPSLITNNNNFNIAIFLNEDCKNAINLIDFMKSLTIKLNDLLYIGNNGYIEGVSKILKDHLQKYSLYERPIHYSISTDSEKNTIHVRHENEWKDKEPDVKDALDKGFNELDKKIDRSFSTNMISNEMTREVDDEIKRHIYNSNLSEQQKVIINSIIPHIKIGGTNCSP